MGAPTLQPAVITGMGAVTALGDGAETLYQRWLAGDVGIQDGEGCCADFDPYRTLTRKEARCTDRFTQFTLAAADEALAQAGWAAGLPYDPDRVATIVGTSSGGIQTILTQYDRVLEHGTDQVSPLAPVMQMPNAAPAMLAQRYGLHGESTAVVGACASGTQVFSPALRLLADPNVDAVVVGGADAAITAVSKGAFTVMGALSRIGVSRPFDRRRDGFVIGEGAAVFVLEREDAALARGATILGRVLGVGSTNDGYHLSAPEPSGERAALAITRAMQAAGIGPEDVDYVNVHGTGTRHNDVTETVAIRRALGEHADRIPMSSTKSSIGHLMGGAGAAEAVATLLTLRDGVAPPTLGLEEPDEGCDLDYIPGAPRQLERNGRPLIALSNSFGLGGHNAVAVFQGA